MLSSSCFGAHAQTKISVVATFTILADFVRQVGGERVEVVSLVGLHGAIHACAPRPRTVKLAGARLIVENGLNLEDGSAVSPRLSASKARIVIASNRVTLRKEGDHDHDHGGVDPHARQNVANAKSMSPISGRAELGRSGGKTDYEARAKAYMESTRSTPKWLRSPRFLQGVGGSSPRTTRSAISGYGIQTRRAGWCLDGSGFWRRT
ncbi:MAG: zinc ABC transporter substrate-binding protein [Methylobacteriaceae bacterium]|nr:zinc ABC transporter substrate-binding protein [Methylobacteriaceae bacterium]